MKSQKDAVFSAIETTLGREVADGEVVELSREQRASVTEIIVNGINSGEVEFSDKAKAKYETTEKLRGYVSGMIGNWLTKDKRLNGGAKYSPKNPGSRFGQGDEVLKNLKALYNMQTDEEKKAQVLAEIEKRKAELSASKVKKVEIDFSAIPADLLSTLNLN